MSKKIRAARLSLGYSQDFMAASLRVSQQAYSKIENDPSSTSLLRLIEIAKILEISLADLLETEHESHFTKNGEMLTQPHAFPNSAVCSTCIHNFSKQISDIALKIEHLNRSLQEHLNPVQQKSSLFKQS